MGQALDILKKVNAVITDDHFVFVSGKHAPIYLNKDALYVHTEETSEMCRLMAEKIKDLKPDSVIGPALGGIVLSQWVAHHLSKMLGREVFAVYTEKTAEGGQQFTRGYDKFVKGKKVVII